MWNDEEVTIKNFINVPKPDPQHMELRMQKVAAAIEWMGDKYCLAIPVEKKSNDAK